MPLFRPLFFALVLAIPAFARQTSDGPKDEKAQKTFKHAMDELREHRQEIALDDFKKADKQDGGRCLDCQRKMIKYGVEYGDWKAAELAAAEMVSEAADKRETALAHYQFALVLMNEGLQKHKDDYFSRTHEEAGKALEAAANFPDAILLDGKALAHLRQDDAAKARFEQFIKMRPESDPDRQRAARFITRPELARARMAPPFEVTTIDGRKISMDQLQGKVVLLDFWATWCGPCREALPHLQNVAKKFRDQPLVILSVSLDDDEQKWKDFIAKNEMSWLQYRDGGFTGPISKMFGVTAIPHTFTIDLDGVMQEEHVGDAAIEGKLKKLLAQVHDAPAAPSAK